MKTLFRAALALLLIATPAAAQQKTNAIQRSGAVLMDDNGVVNDSTHPVYVSVQSSPITVIDGSGSIAVAATSQQVFAANTARKYLFIQNPSATVSGVAAENCFVNIGATATSTGTSYELANLGALTFDSNAVPTGAVNIVCATLNHKFVAKQG